MRVLGIDPGTLALGFGVIENDSGEPRAVEFGCLKLRAQEPFAIRLKKIYHEISAIIERCQPDEFAIESLFYARNAQVAIKMGHARGVVIVAAANHDLSASEYAPREIKLSVAGTGSASKEQVQRMIQHLLHLPKPPEPLDASDALAVALCHSFRAGKNL